MRAIGYTRVSTETQAERGVSLDTQAERIKALAIAKGWKLIEIIEDAGFSGKNLQRPGISRLIEVCKDRATDVVIVYKLDRITRKQRDLWYLLEDVFALHDVGFISVTEPFDTTAAMGKAFLSMLGTFAQLERDLISERTAASLKHKRDNGWKTGGDIPFGFRVGDDGRLHADEKEQGAVKLILDLRAEGKSLRDICRALETNGYRTKRGKSKWHSQVILQIINCHASFHEWQNRQEGASN